MWGWIAQEGQQAAFETFLGVRPQADMRLGLFVNDRDPSPDDGIGDYEEASFPGYRAVVLGGDGWTVEDRVASQAPRTFERSETGQTVQVRGYLVTCGGALVAARRFVVPYALTNAGDSVTVTAAIERA